MTTARHANKVIRSVVLMTLAACESASGQRIAVCGNDFDRIQGPPPQLRLSITCPVEVIRQGDPIPIEFTITNEGDSAYRFRDIHDGWMQPCRLWAQYQLTEEIGVPLRIPRDLPPQFACWSGPSGSSEEIKPGKSFRRNVELHEWATITGPGVFTVGGSYHGDAFSTHQIRVDSDPITIEIVKRSEMEMLAYVDSLIKKLQTRLQAEKKAGIEDVIRRMAYTRRMETLPAIIEVMYTADRRTHWDIKALKHYLPDKQRIAQALYEAGMTRGLVSGMDESLIANPAVPRLVLFPLIQKSLELSNRACWEQGANLAQRFPDDRHTKRLAAIALSEVDLTPHSVLYALACHRTKEGVAALRALLQSEDKSTREATEQAIRHAYLVGGAHSRGRPLHASDFPKRLQRRKPEEPPDADLISPVLAGLLE